MIYRPTIAEIDLDAIRSNTRAYSAILPADAALMAVVKADGYGHGAIACLQAGIQEGVNWAGIALMEEAIELRKAGIQIPILLLGGFFNKCVAAFFEWEITPTIYSLDSAKLLQKEAKKRNTPIKIHLKLDTGMGRLGLHKNQLEEFLEGTNSYSHLILDGVMTHFAAADEKDKSFSLQQLETFNHYLQLIQKKHNPRWIHAANSAGTSELTEERGNLFRVGIGFYGQQPSSELLHPLQLQEALHWKTQIIQLQDFETGSPLSYGCTFITKRPSKIATLAVGYADGYPRLLSNQGQVLIHGKRCPVVGRVCMDMILIDVTDLPDVKLNDTVTLIGKEGSEQITASELASLTGTINYEITCGISKRVPRNYIHKSD